MPKAIPTDTTTAEPPPLPTRRAALSALGWTATAAISGAVLAHSLGEAAAAVTSSPDADLIRACASFDALERRINDYGPDGATPIEDDHERARVVKPFKEQQRPLMERICAGRAATLEGIAARARSLALWAPDLVQAGPGKCWDDRMITAVLRDLAAIGGQA